MSYLNSVKEIPVGDYSESRYDGPPRFYWHNGERKAGTPGSFYIKAEELPGETPGEPWEAVERFQGEEGYAAAKLRIAIIGYRSQAFKQDGDTRVWLAEWAEGARFQTEILCFAKGIETAPLVLVTKGMTGKAFTQKGQGIIAQYREHLLDPASKQAGRRLPLWTFWLPLSTLVQNGATAYLDTGFKNTYTPPMVHPKALSLDAADSLFVGDQLYLAGDSIRQEYDAWLKQRRGGVEAAEQAQGESEDIDWDAPRKPQAPARAQAPAAAAGRGRGVEEVDLPY